MNDDAIFLTFRIVCGIFALILLGLTVWSIWTLVKPYRKGRKK
jgi:hypothetical protein